MLKSKIALLFIVTLCVACLLAAGAMADDSTTTKKEQEVTHDYIGAKKCKICHKDVFTSWEKTVHAKAFDLLKPEEQKKEECTVCHITGTTVKGAVLEGVQCEGCHGPGADYKKKKIMQDKELAIKNGLVIPTEETCVRCHNKKSPTFKSFDFEKQIKNPEAIHKIATKEKAKS